MNITNVYVYVISSLLLTLPINAFCQTVVNGGFELGTDPGVSLNINAPNSTIINGWTVQSRSIDYIGTRWVCGEGVRCLDLSGEDAGSIFQNVSGFVPGQLYELSFLMAGNPEAGPLTKSLIASIGSTFETFSFSGSGSKTDLGWVTQRMIFSAATEGMTLSFTSLNRGFSGPALDLVAITPVPEPHLATAGLVAAIVFLWRRKRSAAR